MALNALTDGVDFSYAVAMETIFVALHEVLTVSFKFLGKEMNFLEMLFKCSPDFLDFMGIDTSQREVEHVFLIFEIPRRLVAKVGGRLYLEAASINISIQVTSCCFSTIALLFIPSINFKTLVVFLEINNELGELEKLR